MSSSGVLLRVERVDAAIVLTIDRPETGNAINLELARSLASTLRTCADVPDVRAIVIMGAGEKFFCSGGDLKAYSGIETPAELEIAFGTARALMDQIENVRLPVVAAINGYALGGGFE